MARKRKVGDTTALIHQVAEKRPALRRKARAALPLPSSGSKPARGVGAGGGGFPDLRVDLPSSPQATGLALPLWPGSLTSLGLGSRPCPQQQDGQPGAAPAPRQPGRGGSGRGRWARHSTWPEEHRTPSGLLKPPLHFKCSFCRPERQKFRPTLPPPPQPYAG